jgi:hypothetical protein
MFVNKAILCPVLWPIFSVCVCLCVCVCVCVCKPIILQLSPFLRPQSPFFTSITVFFSEVPCFHCLLYIVSSVPSRPALFTFVLWYHSSTILVSTVLLVYPNHINCFCTSSIMYFSIAIIFYLFSPYSI